MMEVDCGRRLDKTAGKKFLWGGENYFSSLSSKTALNTDGARSPYPTGKVGKGSLKSVISRQLFRLLRKKKRRAFDSRTKRKRPICSPIRGEGRRSRKGGGADDTNTFPSSFFCPSLHPKRIAFNCSRCMKRERERGAKVTEEAITTEAVADRNNYYSTLGAIESERKNGTAHTLLFFTRGGGGEAVTSAFVQSSSSS